MATVDLTPPESAVLSVVAGYTIPDGPVPTSDVRVALVALDTFIRTHRDGAQPARRHRDRILRKLDAAESGPDWSPTLFAFGPQLDGVDPSLEPTDGWNTLLNATAVRVLTRTRDRQVIAQGIAFERAHRRRPDVIAYLCAALETLEGEEVSA